MIDEKEKGNDGNPRELTGTSLYVVAKYQQVTWQKNSKKLKKHNIWHWDQNSKNFQKINFLGIWTYQGIEQIMRKRNPMPVWPNSFQNDTFLMKYWKNLKICMRPSFRKLVKISKIPPGGQLQCRSLCFSSKSQKCNSFSLCLKAKSYKLKAKG